MRLVQIGDLGIDVLVELVTLQHFHVEIALNVGRENSTKSLQLAQQTEFLLFERSFSASAAIVGKEEHHLCPCGSLLMLQEDLLLLQEFFKVVSQSSLDIDLELGLLLLL